MSDGEEQPGDPPCHAHLIIGGHLVDRQTFRDVSRFRKSERLRLYARRKQLSHTERQAATEALSAHLLHLLEARSFETIAA